MGILTNNKKQLLASKRNRLASRLTRLSTTSKTQMLQKANQIISSSMSKKAGQSAKLMSKKNQSALRQVLSQKKKIQKTVEQKKEKQKVLAKKKNEEVDQMKEMLEMEEQNQNQQYYDDINQNLQISQEDEDILKQFAMINSGNQQNKLVEALSKNIETNLQEKEQEEKEKNILFDPKVKTVYQDIAKLMKEYTSGKLCRAFRAIPLLDQWEDVLLLTHPHEWSPQGMSAATIMLMSSLDNEKATVFFEKYLLPAVRKNIQKFKKLNYHYYIALKKSLYKPAAWFKGILFPLCQSGNCTIKEAQIIGSILSKQSINVLHTSVALIKLTQFEFSGPTCIFLKVLLMKKYSLTLRVISALIDYFKSFGNQNIQMPNYVRCIQVFDNLLLNNFEDSLDDMQKVALKTLVKKKSHKILTEEIVKVIDGKKVESKQISKRNIQKSLEQQQKMLLE